MVSAISDLEFREFRCSLKFTSFSWLKVTAVGDSDRDSGHGGKGVGINALIAMVGC